MTTPTESTPEAAQAAAASESATAHTLTQWLKAAGVRAVKTAAQAALGIIPASALTIGGIDWIMVAGATALAAVISLITSIAGIPEVADGNSLKQITNN
jgi:hypothetical protein